MSENKILDDIAKFGNTTLTTMSTVQRQVRKWAGEQVDQIIRSMDLITEEEFEVYRLSQENRISKLEAKIAKLEGKTKPAAAKPKAKAKAKPTAKKAAPKKKAPAKKKAAKK